VSYVTLAKEAAPSAPAAGSLTVYPDAAGRVRALDATGVDSVLSPSARVNYVRNSGKWFAQRQAPATATTYSSTTGRAIAADGFGITNENASATYQRTDTAGAVETGLQGRFYGNYLKITTLGKLMVTQVLEGSDAVALRGRTVRVQCWMKQLVGAAPVVRLGLIQLAAAGTIDAIPAAFISAFGANGVDPTLGTNLARINPKAGVTGDNCTLNGAAYDCTLSSAWQRFGGVFDVPSDCKNLVVAIWGNAQFAATNGFALAQVSLTDGYEIQDWSPALPTVELDRVQRFYSKSFGIDTAPAQNVGLNTGEHKWVKVVAGATAARSPVWRFPVRMRAAPTTTTLYSPGSASAQVRDETNTVDCTASAVVAGSDTGVAVTATGNAATVAEGLLGVHLSCDAEL